MRSTFEEPRFVCIRKLVNQISAHFTYVADSAQEYFDNLKALIEDTYIKNNKTSVVLVCHGLGCP